MTYLVLSGHPTWQRKLADLIAEESVLATCSEDGWWISKSDCMILRVPLFPGPSKIPRRLTLQKVGFYRGGFTIGSPYGSPYGEQGILQRILGTHKTCKGRHSNGVEGAVLLGFALQKVVKNGKNYSQRSWKHSLIASTFCKLKLMVWLGV